MHQREYSITAQFQVYRPSPHMSDLASSSSRQPHQQQQSANIHVKTPEMLNYSTTDSMDTDDSVSPGCKRRASPEFPHIPKKRYAHCKFEQQQQQLMSSTRRPSTESCEPTTSSTSAVGDSSDCYVVESQLSPGSSTSVVPPPPSSSSLSSSDDSKDADSMWRPW